MTQWIFPSQTLLAVTRAEEREQSVGSINPPGHVVLSDLPYMAYCTLIVCPGGQIICLESLSQIRIVCSSAEKYLI